MTLIDHHHRGMAHVQMLIRVCIFYGNAVRLHKHNTKGNERTNNDGRQTHKMVDARGFVIVFPSIDGEVRCSLPRHPSIHLYTVSCGGQRSPMAFEFVEVILSFIGLAIPPSRKY